MLSEHAPQQRKSRGRGTHRNQQERAWEPGGQEWNRKQGPKSAAGIAGDVPKTPQVSLKAEGEPGQPQEVAAPRDSAHQDWTQTEVKYAQTHKGPREVVTEAIERLDDAMLTPSEESPGTPQPHTIQAGKEGDQVTSPEL